MTHASSKRDVIWNKIRNTLRDSAMSRMTIPQAVDFQIRTTPLLGVHVRELVDYEITQALKELKEEAVYGHLAVPDCTEFVPVSAIDQKIKALEGEK